MPADDPRPSSFRVVESVKRIVIGAPRDLADQSIFHRIALVPILAWIGLGADGLSSSSYGPEEAFRALGEHRYLAVVLAALVAATIATISLGYSKIIERFPQGGGGYVVAGALLGPNFGVVSGSALVIDYVLTITVSIASAGDTLFSFLPAEWAAHKMTVEYALIAGLIVLNFRGVRESVVVLAPVFATFLVTHAVLILGVAATHVPDVPETATRIGNGFSSGYASLGLAGLALLVVHAYSMGAGTFTGIEAVSNGLPIMREPRVATAKRTMWYMAVSLTLTATGLMICYLLLDLDPVHGKTMNAVLTQSFSGDSRWGRIFAIVTLVSEGALLVVAAQAGFLDGPRVLANMSIDGWMPRRFAMLSDRLTTQNGIVFMGVAAMAALAYTHGDIRHLVVMYSINVFVTFSLSMLGMLRMWWSRRTDSPRERRRHLALFGIGFAMCVTILSFTVVTKFSHGGWITVLVTSVFVVLAFAVHRHYRALGKRLTSAFADVADAVRDEGLPVPALDPSAPTAVVLVSAFSGLGVHTILNILRRFPGQFRNMVFVGVGVVDSAALREEHPADAVRARVETSLGRYVELAGRLGLAAEYRFDVGTDVVDVSERLCIEVAERYEAPSFIAGKVVFRDRRWFHGLLHNDTAFEIQRRLQLAGHLVIVVPARV